MRKITIGLVVALALVFTAIPFAASAQDAGPLDHVVISPVTANITTGGTHQFTAVAEDSNNITIAGLTYTWSVENGGGSVNNTGFFTAGNATGTFSNTVNVTATQGSISKTALATVIITAGTVQKPSTPPGWSRGNKTGWNGGSVPPGFSQGGKNGWGGGSMPPGLSNGVGGGNGASGNNAAPGQGNNTPAAANHSSNSANSNRGNSGKK